MDNNGNTNSEIVATKPLFGIIKYQCRALM